MTSLYEAKYLCGDCKSIFPMLSTARPDPDNESWIKGFVCEACIAKRRNTDFWSRLANG